MSFSSLEHYASRKRDDFLTHVNRGMILAFDYSSRRIVDGGLTCDWILKELTPNVTPNLRDERDRIL